MPTTETKGTTMTDCGTYDILYDEREGNYRVVETLEGEKSGKLANLDAVFSWIRDNMWTPDKE